MLRSDAARALHVPPTNSLDEFLVVDQSAQLHCGHPFLSAPEVRGGGEAHPGLKTEQDRLKRGVVRGLTDGDVEKFVGFLRLLTRLGCSVCFQSLPQHPHIIVGSAGSSSARDRAMQQADRLAGVTH